MPQRFHCFELIYNNQLLKVKYRENTAGSSPAQMSRMIWTYWGKSPEPFTVDILNVSRFNNSKKPQ